jgi:hypothetical protein
MEAREICIAKYKKTLKFCRVSAELQTENIGRNAIEFHSATNIVLEKSTHIEANA